MVHHNSYADIDVLKTNMLTYVHPSCLDISSADVYPNVLSWNERYVGSGHSDFFMMLGVSVLCDGKNTYAGFKVKVESILEKEKAMVELHRLFYAWSSTQSEDANTWFAPLPDYG